MTSLWQRQTKRHCHEAKHFLELWLTGMLRPPRREGRPKLSTFAPAWFL
jgi:hypothetical protein